ncbi:hypothetical protein CTAYLR_008671 [Chrysophaeum taylorii]|uniref:Mannosyltransferase n=1 Tax=Chrysophaeum taylorii TaxID=2483200 RepID=A0AAD7UQB6_9STRA|nr:hypothetical protein CTAYLR_008671 [Chrysophaeum taylorii]
MLTTTTVALTSWALLVALIAPGYVHPDEFFQSVEIAGRDLLGHGGLAWEWGGPSPDPSWRSYVPCRSISFAVVSAHLPIYFFSKNPLAAPRVWVVLVSIANDAFVLGRVWKECGVDVDAARLSYRLSWTSWILLARPLSNAYEAMALPLAFLIRHRPVAFGALAALVTFWRFSFLFFAFPLAIRQPPVSALSFALTAGALVALDSWYFGALAITPLNNLLFNSSSERLRVFGLHPRPTHLFNALFLFGPSAVNLFKRSGHPNLDLLRACALSGFVALSASRHQEPRFLLAMAPAVFATPLPVTNYRPAAAAAAAANIGIGAFYAFVHQAAVTRVLLAPHPPKTCLLFFGCYLAPRALNPNLQIFDYQQPDIDAFLDDAPCLHNNNTRLAVAMSFPRRPLRAALRRRGLDMTRIAIFAPHFSAEYPPRSLGHLRLGLFDLSAY